MASNSEISNQEPIAKKSPFDELSRDELIHKCKGLLTIAQKAKIARSELQTEVENYKLQLTKYESEKKASLENIQTLQELVDSLTEQKLNFITEVDSAQNKIKLLSEKCNNYEEDIKIYKSDLITKDKNINDINQKLSNIDCEIISLKRQNKRLVEENEQLINQLTDIEAKTTEFNNIGLQQQEQLRILEDSVNKDDEYKKTIEELNVKIKELESLIQEEREKSTSDYECKIQEITQLYETEKSKKDKVNIKLRVYKDKILKCATCINQLKNSRFILAKTVQEYSENIPKWQNDIIKASKVLDNQILQLNDENSNLKEKLKQMQKHINENVLSQDESYQSSIINNNNEKELLKVEIENLKKINKETLDENTKLNVELTELKIQYKELMETQLPTIVSENEFLKGELNDKINVLNELALKDSNSINMIESLIQENKMLNNSIKHKPENDEVLENLSFQIKALESEKSILVKEKLNAKDYSIELEHQNKVLTQQVAEMTAKINSLTSQLDTILKENMISEKKHYADKEGEINILKCEMMTLQEQYDRLKKEYEDLQDLNGLLREEVDTLKFSLEQPKDDSENLSDLNVSLQADIVKLETKLSAYKQENSSLLVEVKELRNKSKEFDSVVAEYEDSKSKLLGYKTENAELLNEMKELNQVLKERGESISKLQKAISEMERLIEVLDKDRESVHQEKAELLKKIEGLENSLRCAEEKTNESCDAAKQIQLERESAIKKLEEKDYIIATLKDEMEKIRQQTSPELPNEDNMSTSTISKAEDHSRMKDLDETFEEKYTKLRIFALKLKKKLNELTNQVQNSEQDKARLEKLLSEQLEYKNTITQKQDIVESSNTEITEINTLEETVKDLSVSLEGTEQRDIEIQKLKAEIENKSQQLASEIEAHKVTKENLEKVRRDVKKNNVLSLEMEDYEKSMKELTNKMDENKKKMIQMESTIDTQEGTITTMKTQIKLLEEQIKTEETQNRLLKEELQHIIEERQEKDNVIQTKNEMITKLEQLLEDEKRKNEESDLELTSLLSEKEKTIMSLSEDKAELNSKVKRLEFKCAELNDNLRILNIELADLKTEYTSYKVRAQAVLRQNQTIDHSQEEQLKEEAAALKTQIETLTVKLTSAQEQCEEQNVEVENARRRAAEVANEATRAQQRTARLQTDLMRLSQQLESERTQNKLQITTLTQCYKTQMGELEAKYKKELDHLKMQLVAAQDITKIGKPVLPIEEASGGEFMLPIIPKDDCSDGEMDINVSLIPREEGEGSESAPSPPPSKPYMTSSGSGRSPVPLERLLEEGVPDDEALDTTSLALTSEQEIADLKRRLQAQQQRVKHITVLLSESERECARMAQLSELLKAELRRVRGSTQNAHNTEYMKNVTLKFLTLPPGDERSRLVPVLQQILTLTADETQKIQAIAKGVDPNASKGWGSYLPWPGGK